MWHVAIKLSSDVYQTKFYNRKKWSKKKKHAILGIQSEFTLKVYFSDEDKKTRRTRSEIFSWIFG